MTKHSFIGTLFLVGSDSEKLKTTKERIILANVMFLMVPIIILISYVLDYKEYLIPYNELNFDQFTRMMFAGASLFCYYLNRQDQFLLSRWVYILSWIAFWLVLDPVVQGTSPDYYFHFDLSIIGLSLVSQILFSYKKEPIIYGFLMVFSLVCIYFQQSYLLHFDANQEFTKTFLNNDYTYLTSIYYWAIFNLIIGYLLFIYEKSNIHLSENNVKLDRLTSNLEEVVEERTTDLRKKQNELIGITERLLESEDKYRKLFTNSFEGIARLELNPPLDTSWPKTQQVAHLQDHLTLVECNHVFAKLYLHKDPTTLIGERLSFIMDHKESMTNLLETYVENDYHLNGKVMTESIHGTNRWFIGHVTSQVDNGKISWLWLNKLDITEKSKQDEERKILLQNLEEYAFQTSHELRGPLSRLLGLTSLMLNKNAFNQEELPEMLKHINNTSIEIDDVIKMMNQVLSRSSYESKLTKDKTKE
ncbi:hypothetical protein N7E81_13820 [Reichenbachiella carrageenanivorans]|uniref:histidine kinase n=1 Tax=Reichenbachiella carrageenanivorans TaxID=2979869 RepID=A0ABY6CYI6_9BACT|nr:hypothetical protein [Reichenbachiella carrageenanivorans]UXX78435.1 hypothetical protein N7E81_13820 [Reichenbachiella carrageenanivorans]